MARLIDADALIAPLKLQMESYDRIGACERAEAYRNCHALMDDVLALLKSQEPTDAQRKVTPWE